MSIVRLPIDSAQPAYSVDVALGATRYRLFVAWNTRTASWSLGIGIPDGPRLVMGQRIVPDYDLFRQQVDERLPAGRIFAIDQSGERRPPGRFDLGERVVIVYADE